MRAAGDVGCGVYILPGKAGIATPTDSVRCNGGGGGGGAGGELGSQLN